MEASSVLFIFKLLVGSQKRRVSCCSLCKRYPRFPYYAIAATKKSKKKVEKVLTKDHGDSNMLVAIRIRPLN